MRFIKTKAGKHEPVNPRAIKADGVKMLVFADGVVARNHEKLTHGYLSHFADCPKAAMFKAKGAQ